MTFARSAWMNFLPCLRKLGFGLCLVSALTQADDTRTCSADKAIAPVRAFPELPPLASPVGLVQAPPTGDFWLAALRDGQIVSFANSPAADSFKVALDIRSKVNNQVEMGLTNIAFHPKYPQDRRIFAIYSDLSQDNRSNLVSFEIDPVSQIVDPASEKLILSLKKGALFHVAGHLTFGPDGYLYAGFGDDGVTPWFAQDTRNLHGSIIRIDVNAEPYAVPADNPFNKGQSWCREGESSDTCPEIYAYGLRNPWRFSFDPATNKLWASDLGLDYYEEINLIEAGKNYGWPIAEGDRHQRMKVCKDWGLTPPFNWWLCSNWPLTPPHNGYTLGGSQAIVGGYVYRANPQSPLYGNYVFGDIYNYDFYMIPADSPPNTPFTRLFNSKFMVASMAQDLAGEIYLLNFSGTEKGEGIYRLEQTRCQP